MCFRVRVVTPGWRRAKNHLPCPRGSCTRCRYKVSEMNLKLSCYPGDGDEGVDREALLQDRCDREGFGQEGHGGGRKVKWPNSFFDFIFIFLAHAISLNVQRSHLDRKFNLSSECNAMMIHQGAAGVRVGHFETNFGGVRGEHCPSKQTSIILNII